MMSFGGRHRIRITPDTQVGVSPTRQRRQHLISDGKSEPRISRSRIVTDQQEIPATGDWALPNGGDPDGDEGFVEALLPSSIAWAMFLRSRHFNPLFLDDVRVSIGNRDLSSSAVSDDLQATDPDVVGPQ
jgi:hypothetical protein